MRNHRHHTISIKHLIRAHTSCSNHNKRWGHGALLRVQLSDSWVTALRPIVPWNLTLLQTCDKDNGILKTLPTKGPCRTLSFSGYSCAACWTVPLVELTMMTPQGRDGSFPSSPPLLIRKPKEQSAGMAGAWNEAHKNSFVQHFYGSDKNKTHTRIRYLIQMVWFLRSHMGVKMHLYLCLKPALHNINMGGKIQAII